MFVFSNMTAMLSFPTSHQLYFNTAISMSVVIRCILLLTVIPQFTVVLLVCWHGSTVTCSERSWLQFTQLILY